MTELLPYCWLKMLGCRKVSDCELSVQSVQVSAPSSLFTRPITALSPLFFPLGLDLIYYSVTACSCCCEWCGRCRAERGRAEAVGCRVVAAASLALASRRLAALAPTLLTLLNLLYGQSNGQPHLPPMDARPGDPIRCAEN